MTNRQAKQDHFGIHGLATTQGKLVTVHINSADGHAEAEAQANALRKRGLQLERHAQQLRAASRSVTASKVPTAPSTHEVAASQQLLPHTQEAAEQVHKPLSIPQLPAKQPQGTQPSSEQCLRSQEGVRLDVAQQQRQQLPSVAAAAPTHQGTASVPAKAVQQVTVEAHAQAAAPQQEEHTPLAIASLAATEALHEEAQGVAAQHEATAQGSVLQGMVVWGNFKGWPAWPGLVTTEEEMDVAEVIGKRGQLLQGASAFGSCSSFTHGQ